MSKLTAEVNLLYDTKKALTVPIMLVTVMHTGTRFFSKLLKQHYGPKRRIADDEQLFYVTHCQPADMPRIIELHKQGVKIITTIRDWKKVEASWIKRYELNGVLTLEDLAMQKSLWYRWVLPHATCVVSVDEEFHREERLEKLGEVLGQEFKTDWEPVG